MAARIDPPVCDSDPQALIGGAWDPNLLDWSDVSEPGADPPKSGDDSDILPHHGSLTAVHAAHLPTGELLMYHGQSEQRLWTIGAAATNMRWVPIPYEWDDDSEYCSYEPPASADDCYPDIFCAGSVLLEQGLFVAGGNVDGTGDGGGIFESFLFDPTEANPALSPYGWQQGPLMQVPRWYPTLTVLRDGTVLVSGGTDGSNANTFELYDPVEGTSTLLDEAEFQWGILPTYPFMFLLPNGDVLYAGGEGAAGQAVHGRVLVPDYDAPENSSWAAVRFDSTINGGSAVMYAPGKVMKSGGLDMQQGLDFAVGTTETLDLSGCTESGNYSNAPAAFTTAAEMNEARHYHTLTVLPDGRVLATGGNEKGNGLPWHSLGNSCEAPGGGEVKEMTCEAATECPAIRGICVGGVCPALGNAACDADIDCAVVCGAECPDGSECHDGACYFSLGPCPSAPQTCAGNVAGGSACIDGECLLGAITGICEGERCDPARNDCWATRSAEIWDPGCDEWVLLGEQQRARMYHSTALLMPNGNVISMGGGHRGNVPEEPNAEYFVPSYGTGAKPIISVDLPTTSGVAAGTYGRQFSITLANVNPATVPPGRVVLVRLGNVTHQFDMDQRWVPLDATWQTPWTGTMPVITAFLPDSRDAAPPGYYMLFVLTATGEPSVGQYVRLTGAAAQVWTCPATPSLTVVETSCTTQPSGGACPGGSQQTNTVAKPQVTGPSGTVNGWNVVATPGMVMDPTAPTADELAAVKGLCVEACELEWSEPAITSQCGVTGAFNAPQFYFADADASVDLIRDPQQNGSGIWTGQQLTCALGSTCWPAFDESLAKAVPARPTPPTSLLGVGEAYRVALGSTSKLDVITALGTYTRQLGGTVGFSPCRDGNTSAPCPFYVGSLVAAAASPLSVAVRCDDLTTDTVSLQEFAVNLVQPGFGIARQNSTQRGFPPGALLFDTHTKVDGVVTDMRRANEANVVATVNGTAISGSNLNVTLRVPCNNSEATITGRLTLSSPTGTAIDWPPTVSITTPSQVFCAGGMVNLAASTSDADADLTGVRWKVDGVLMAPGTTAIPFTGPHTLEAIASDARGAKTTARKVVTCAPL